MTDTHHINIKEALIFLKSINKFPISHKEENIKSEHGHNCGW